MLPARTPTALGVQLTLPPSDFFMQLDLPSAAPPPAGSITAARAPIAPLQSRQIPIPWRWKPQGKGRSMGTDPLTAREQAGRLLRLPVLEERPTSRDQCKNGQRPCPWVSCRSHLYMDVNLETGSIKVNFPGLESTDEDAAAERFDKAAARVRVKRQANKAAATAVRAQLAERFARQRAAARDLSRRRRERAEAAVAASLARHYAGAERRIKVKARKRRAHLAVVTVDRVKLRARGRTAGAARAKLARRLAATCTRIVRAKLTRVAWAHAKSHRALLRDLARRQRAAARRTIATHKRCVEYVARARVRNGWISATARTSDDARKRLLEVLRLVILEDETRLDLTQMEDTCARDVAERYEERGVDLEHGGRLMNVTMERFRQLTRFALDEVRAKDSDGQDIPPIVDDPDEDESGAGGPGL